jgi:geranylgeranylglycerol-phosphate geranylgeranyltransferase
VTEAIAALTKRASLHKSLYVAGVPAVQQSLISRHHLTMAMASETRVSGSLAWATLLRPGNCLMGAVGVLLAALICAGPDTLMDYLVEVALSMFVVAAFTGGGNALNDYFDRDVDKIAHPERPIPMGAVSPRNAMWLSLSLFSASVVVSAFVNAWSFLIVITSVGLMAAYELLLKAEGLAGNLTISWLTGALFLFGGAAVEMTDVAWVLAALAFLATLGREVVKDIQDVKGDRGSRTTLPMRLGPKRAGVVASSAFVGAVALSPVPYVWELLSVWYVPVVLAADGMFIYCAAVHFADPKRGQKMAKLAMLVALVAFLLGGVT